MQTIVGVHFYVLHCYISVLKYSYILCTESPDPSGDSVHVQGLVLLRYFSVNAGFKDEDWSKNVDKAIGMLKQPARHKFTLQISLLDWVGTSAV